jgi:hypothetical protein
MLENQIIMEDVADDYNDNCYICPVWDNSVRRQFVDILDPVSILELNNELVHIVLRIKVMLVLIILLRKSKSHKYYIKLLINAIYYWK